MSEVENKNNNENCGGIYEQKKYFALALDPIYVGTGGYRIGRVDNTIVREPATGIPKIPGTTIEGCCRSYAYLQTKSNGESVKLACAKGKKIKIKEKKTENGKEKTVEIEKEPCGNCRICITFGYTTDTKSMQAMALFSDARILFFPVATMVGPVWVTCPMVLRDAGMISLPEPSNKEFIANKNLEKQLPKENEKYTLNFGWLILKGDVKEINLNLPKSEEIQNILNRIVIVPDDLFATIVNSNLEVRTSVAIDPERGAVEEGALFTYEAIPRVTVLWFDVIYQNPKNFQMNDWNTELIIKTVEDGFSLFEYLGIGGMGSRGFGRLKVIGNFLPFDEYLKALKERLKILRKNGKSNEIKEICNYLKNQKSRIEKEIEVHTSWVKKIDEIIGKFCG